MKDLFWSLVVIVEVWLLLMFTLVVMGVSIVLAYRVTSTILGGLH